MSHVSDEMHNLEHVAEDFRDSEKHYLREDIAFFPILEKHWVTEIPSIMWMEYNQIRDKRKNFRI